MDNTPVVPLKADPKDIFLHLLSIITLYASAVAFLTLVFQYVNYTFPAQYESIDSDLAAMRWAISALVIMFPAYLVTMRFIRQGFTADPAKQRLRIRKWLAYFTIFLASLTGIINLVVLLNTLLNGDFTTRFLIKVLAVFFVAGSIFKYYLWDIRREQ